MPDARSSEGFKLPEKRQRVTRACDTCRRKKAKCDQDARPGERCYACLEADLVCTWNDDVKKRGRKRAVEALERRLNALEQALSPQGSGKSRNAVSSPDNDSPSYLLAEDNEEEEEASNFAPLLDRVSRLELTSIGQGSSFDLSYSTGNRVSRRIMQLSLAYDGPDIPITDTDPWEGEEVARIFQNTPQYIFPPHDLLMTLVAAFMDHVNVYVPVFHRPTFELSVVSGQHLYDPEFGALLLLVCAMGSHFVDDVRVLLPGAPKRSSGWAYWRQVGITSRDLLSPPTLYTIQSYIVAALFIGPCYTARIAWTLVGVALRCLQEVGAHRNKVYGSRPQPEDELWKRAFWVLVQMDVTIASETGRPCLLTDGQFDVEFPVECDDAFWNPEDPSQAFKQPAGTPSYMAYFLHIVKLKLIHLKAMRTIFSAESESKDRRAKVTIIESELDAWEAATPPQLRWGFKQTEQPVDDVFFVQKAKLRLNYYHLRIVLHRPFILTRKPSAEVHNALSICVNAARASSRILGAVNDRYLMNDLPQSLVRI